MIDGDLVQLKAARVQGNPGKFWLLWVVGDPQTQHRSKPRESLSKCVEAMAEKTGKTVTKITRYKGVCTPAEAAIAMSMCSRKEGK